MPDQDSFPRYIFGLHEPDGEWLMEEKGRKGWILFTHALGHDPNDHNGFDYRRWSDRGFGIIARLNHGYGSAGTLPKPQFYDAFAHRVRFFVANSLGCHIWIIGNEMNHGQERPDGQVITPDRYAICYKKCWDQIHSLAGRARDQVAVGAVAPWNNTTAYPGNDNGDWVRYFVDILGGIRNLGCSVDAITLHTYTHGHDPQLVFSEQKMNPPFQDRHFQFRCYQDFMKAIPTDLRHLPVYATETDQNEAWENANRGWVQNAYKEINDWNITPGNQQIRALILYRWPKFDRWHIEDVPGVYDDFREAMDHEYVWREAQQINDHTLEGAFLDAFERWGQEHCGLPISDQVIEEGRRTQYFERLVMQLAPSGQVVLKAAGTEVQSLRQTVLEQRQQIQVLENQIDSLQARLRTLEGQLEIGAVAHGEQIVEVVRPLWENVVYTLTRHATKEYDRRQVEQIKQVVINHSAVPATLTAEQIALFHVNHMDWPGIGYHFYVDEQGQIFLTNDLSTVCYHVGQWDPISVGICVGGNFTHQIPNQAQLQSTAHLAAWLLQELGLSLDALVGKKELIDTQSPGLQWLAGQKWKTLLQEAIVKARETHAKPHLLKPLHHYLLFWQYPDDWAREDWQGAKEYIGRFRLSHGFSVNDAQVAKYVTIVGGTSGVNRAAERILLDAGCRVERVCGKNRSQTLEILTEMAQRGQRFLNFAD